MSDDGTQVGVGFSAGSWRGTLIWVGNGSNDTQINK